MALLDNYSSTMASYQSLLQGNPRLAAAAAAHHHQHHHQDWSVVEAATATTTTSRSPVPAGMATPDPHDVGNSSGGSGDGVFRPYSSEGGHTGSSPPSGGLMTSMMGQTELHGAAAPIDLKTTGGGGGSEYGRKEKVKRGRWSLRTSLVIAASNLVSTIE